MQDINFQTTEEYKLKRKDKNVVIIEKGNDASLELFTFNSSLIRALDQFEITDEKRNLLKNLLEKLK